MGYSQNQLTSLHKNFLGPHKHVFFVHPLRLHTLWSKTAWIRSFIKTHQTTCCLQVIITTVLFPSQMRPDSIILYNLSLGRGGRVFVCVRESVCPFGPSFWLFSQSNECERECKGSQSPQRAKHCLNDVITIHSFPPHLFHLHILSRPSSSILCHCFLLSACHNSWDCCVLL